MIGGEIGEPSGRALQERAPVSQRLIQPIEWEAAGSRVISGIEQNSGSCLAAAAHIQ
jgi:hypothetical protein